MEALLQGVLNFFVLHQMNPVISTMMSRQPAQVRNFPTLRVSQHQLFLTTTGEKQSRLPQHYHTRYSEYTGSCLNVHRPDIAQRGFTSNIKTDQKRIMMGKRNKHKIMKFKRAFGKEKKKVIGEDLHLDASHIYIQLHVYVRGGEL